MGELHLPTPPVGGRGIVAKAYHDLNPAFDTLGGAADPRLAQPLAIYLLRADQIAEGRNLGDARPIGWRYVLDGPDGYAYADLQKRGKHMRFAGLSRNRNAERLVEALSLAENLIRDSAESPEARFLDVPSPHVAAVWLTTRDPILIPYVEARPGGALRVQGERGFLTQLREAAGRISAEERLPLAEHG